MDCFALVGIENGWFKALFYSFDKSILLWGTDVGQYDVGKELIRAICSICSNKTEKENICFNEEDKAYILTIKRINNNFVISICELFEPPFHYIGKCGLQLEHIKKGQIVFETDGQLKELAQNILLEFSKYNHKDFLKLYESNWFPFPTLELDELQKVIKKLE